MDATPGTRGEAGRRQALAALVRTQAGRLYGIALRITGQPDLAEDAVQETFVRVLEGRDPPPEPAAASAWLARVAANQALEILRRRAARRRREERYAMTRDETQHPEVTPTLSAEEERMLSSELGRLEPETRAAIWLHEVEGVSLRDAAEALGASRSGVARRIGAGLALLRKRLEGRGLALRGITPLPALLRSLPVPQAPAALIARLDAIAAAAAQAGAAGLAAVGTGAAGAVAALAPAAPAVSHTITIGGFLMSGKKIALSLGLSALILGGAAILVKPWERAGNRADPALAGGRGAVPAAATDVQGAGGPGSEPGGAAADAASTSREARSVAGVSLRGRVTGDGGEPVPGARVIALPLAEWKRVDAEGPRDRAAASLEELAALRDAYRKLAASLPEVRAETDGSYAFQALRAGDYRLLAAHADYLPSIDNRAEVGGAPRTVDIELLRGSTIRGKIVDLEGAALAGARVRAEPSAAGAARSGGPVDVAAWESGLEVIAPGEAVSGGDGTFSIPSLEPIHHDLAATMEGYLEGNAWGVPAGASDCTIALDPGAAVSGRIVDESGSPVARAEIDLRPARSSEVHRIFDWGGRLNPLPGADARRAVSGEDGRFRIGGLFPAVHDLGVSKKERSPVLREVEVGNEDVDVGDVPLELARRISGIVKNPDRTPCAGARVAATRPRKSVRGSNTLGQASLEALVETVSDAGGRFVLEGVPGSAFSITASREGLEVAELHGVEPGSEDLELILAEGYRIFGKVVDPERSAGVEGAEVIAGFHRERRATSRADGTFEIRGLGRADVYRGTAYVRVEHPDYGPCSAQVAATGTSPAAPAVLRLGRAGKLRGRVLDGSGAPVGGARVWIELTGLTRDSLGWNPVSGVAALSAEDGSFVLTPPESLGNTIGDLAVEVMARDPRFAPGRVGPLSLPRHGDDWPAADIVLAEGGTIRGRVKDTSGKDVARARIAARRPAVADEGRASARGTDALETVTYSGKDGGFVIRALELGPVELEVISMEHARKTVGGLEVGSSPVDVEILLDAGGTLAGRVVDESGEPIPDVEVAAFPERDPGGAPGGTASEFAERMATLTIPGWESVRTSSEGRFKLTRLPEGAYRIIARTPGFEPATISGVEPGQDVPNLTLLRYSAIRGRVLDRATRRPIRSFVVDVINKTKRAELQAKTNFKDPRLGTEGSLRFEDPLGRFSFDGLRPAEYAVSVGAEGFMSITRDVTLSTGTELPAEFLLEIGNTLSGVVLEKESGAPIAGAVVGIGYDRRDPNDSLDASMYRREDVVTAADGSFAIGGLRDGKYHVMASHPFYRRDAAMVTAEIRGGEPAEPVEIRLAPGGRLEIEVRGMPRGHSRKTALRYSVNVSKVEEGKTGGDEEDESKRPNPWAGFINVQQDSSGRFFAESLEPGLYAVRLEMQEMEESEQIQLGPMGGFSASMPKGEKKVAPLGNVEVRAGETAWLEGKAP